MRFEQWIITCALFMGCMAPVIIAKKTVVCYMVAWGITRQGDGKFSVLDADTEHCTHIIYAFMGLDQDTTEIKSIDPNIDLSNKGRGHNQLVKLKQLKVANPAVKVMVSIGGYNERGRKFSIVAGDPQLRQTFIRSVMDFLKKYELDGLDICWQFPGQRGGRKEDKVNSVILFQEIKEAFKPEGYVLTIHILGKKYIIDEYDIRGVSEVVDYINLIPVEFSGPWERTTGVFAPLVAKNENSVKFAVDYTVKQMSNPNKLILGLPLYGHAYVLEETPSADHLIGLFSDKTFHGQWTNEGGIIGSNEVCYNFKNTEGWTKVWHEESQTPLAFKEKQFMSYDNERSLLLKADLVEAKSLGGVMFWSLDMEDFRGLCYGKKYPLISAITNYINNGSRSPSSEPEGSSRPTPGNSNGENTGGQASTEDTDDLGSPDQFEPKPSSKCQHKASKNAKEQNRQSRSTDERKVVACYIAAWSSKRNGAGKFSVHLADVDHCTHIIYAFMTLDESTYEIKSVDNRIDRVQLPKLKELKREKAGLKVMASVGGWNQGATRFSNMADTEEKRKIFIDSVVKFIKEHDLDGIDICWQFPTQRGGKPEDKLNSLKLFKEMKRAFKQDGYLLTVHVLAQRYIMNSFDILEVSDVVDYINFLAVEYHGPWEKTIQPTTPLFSSDESNVKFNVDLILDEGVSPTKLLLGLPTYGHAYQLAEPPRGKYIDINFDHGVTSQWTNEPGLVAYNELCYDKSTSDGGWGYVWEDNSQTPISYNDRKLYTYEDERSLKLKAKLVQDHRLAGVVFWSIDMDDFRGQCHGRKYPLLSTVTDYINKKQTLHTSPSSSAEPKPIHPASNSTSTIVSYEFGN